MADIILAIYRSELELQAEWVLKILVEHYELSCPDNKSSYIDALVEHFRQQLEGGTATLSGGCTKDPLSQSHNRLFRDGHIL